jgi:hypothetical protein
VARARGTVAIGFIAARTRGNSPAVGPPPVPPARPEVPDAALGRSDDLVEGLRARDAGRPEAVAHLDALDRLDAHRGGGEAGVQAAVPVDVGAEADRHSAGEDLDAAEGVAVPVGLVDLRDHRLRRAGMRACGKRRKGRGT